MELRRRQAELNEKMRAAAAALATLGKEVASYDSAAETGCDAAP